MFNKDELKEWISLPITQAYLHYLRVECEQLKDLVVASETMEEFMFRKGLYQEANDLLKALEEMSWT